MEDQSDAVGSGPLGRVTSAAVSRLARHVAPRTALARAVGPVVARVARGRPLMVRVASGPARGMRVFIDSNNEKFLWSGHHEQHVLLELQRRIRSGDCLWDIGAHIGYVSCFAARLLAPGCVVAFEPQPTTRGRLERTVVANQLNNVVVASYAIAGRSGQQPLFADDSSAKWSLQERPAKASTLVDCLTLDLAGERLPAPTVIKIDVEGAELDVLLSGPKLLREHKPWLIVEFSSDDVVERARIALPGYSFRLLGCNHWVLTPG